MGKSKTVNLLFLLTVVLAGFFLGNIEKITSTEKVFLFSQKTVLVESESLPLLDAVPPSVKINSAKFNFKNHSQQSPFLRPQISAALPDNFSLIKKRNSKKTVLIQNKYFNFLLFLQTLP